MNRAGELMGVDSGLGLLLVENEAGLDGIGVFKRLLLEEEEQEIELKTIRCPSGSTSVSSWEPQGWRAKR